MFIPCLIILLIVGGLSLRECLKDDGGGGSER